MMFCAKKNSICIKQGHSSFVTHLDWSMDGVYLCSNSGDYEVLYCKFSPSLSLSFSLFAKNVDIGNTLIFKFVLGTIISGKIPACKQETSISAVRDLEWATGNCTLTFNAAGMELFEYVEIMLEY